MTSCSTFRLFAIVSACVLLALAAAIGQCVLVGSWSIGAQDSLERRSIGARRAPYPQRDKLEASLLALWCSHENHNGCFGDKLLWEVLAGDDGDSTELTAPEVVRVVGKMAFGAADVDEANLAVNLLMQRLDVVADSVVKEHEFFAELGEISNEHLAAAAAAAAAMLARHQGPAAELGVCMCSVSFYAIAVPAFFMALLASRFCFPADALAIDACYNRSHAALEWWRGAGLQLPPAEHDVEIGGEPKRETHSSVVSPAPRRASQNISSLQLAAANSDAAALRTSVLALEDSPVCPESPVLSTWMLRPAEWSALTKPYRSPTRIPLPPTHADWKLRAPPQ